MKLGRTDILPMWVTVTLKELGRFMFRGFGKAVRETKALESKHIYLDTPESIIHVLVLKIERQVPEYLVMVPTTSLAFMSVPELLESPPLTCLIN